MPFHEEGGDWTVYDCLAGSARFTIGLLWPGGGRRKLEFGKAVLLTTDRSQGAAFVDAFARAFRERTPSPRTPQALVPRVIGAVLLSDEGASQMDDSKVGGGGRWLASKLFLRSPTRDGEVYLDLNPAKGVGRFVEKDPEDAADLVAILAMLLRDGPRPRRTPSSDPRLVTQGPTILAPRALGTEKAMLLATCPGGEFVILWEVVGPGRNVLVRTNPLDPASWQQSAPTMGEPREARCLDRKGTRILVEETFAPRGGQQPAEERSRLLWLDWGKAPVPLGWPTAQVGLHLPDRPLSPDGRFVAIRQQKASGPGEDDGSVVHFLDRATGLRTTVQHSGRSTAHLGWRKVGTQQMAVLKITGPSKAQVRFVLAEPRGGSEAPASQVPTNLEPGKELAPDGQHRFSIKPGGILVITEVTSGRERRDSFHPDDRDEATPDRLTWVSPRYLYFSGEQPLFIDIASLKMNSATSNGLRLESPTWDPGLRWVIHEHRQRLHVSRISVVGSR